MKELRRRQAEATGRAVPKGSRPTGEDDPDAEDREDDEDDPADLDTLAGDHQASDDRLVGDDGSDDGDGSPSEPRPIPLRRPRRRPIRGSSPAGSGEGRPPPRTPRT